MIRLETLSDPIAIDRVLRSAVIAPKLRHDGREPGYVAHPLLTYWGAYVGEELAGVFMAVRFSQWEIEAHVAILPEHLGKGRALARLFLARMFDQPQIERITGYVLGTLPSAGNFCRKVGFRHEGTRRSACRVDGVLTDVHVYGLTRGDWIDETSS